MEGGPLAEGHGYVLCDSRVSGFPIRYASAGFKTMFRYEDGESPARAERLAGCSCLADSEAAVAAAARAAGLKGGEVVAALQVLEDMADEACRRFAGGEGDGDVGSVLLVKARRGGEMFACELALLLLRHPATDWSFLVGLHRDVTPQVSVRELLQAAALGPQPVRTLLGGLHKRWGCQGELLTRPESVQHLHKAFDQVWQGFLSGLGSKGGGAQGDKPHSSSGRHKKKAARSEVSAATTASHVSAPRSRKSRGGQASTDATVSRATAATSAASSSSATLMALQPAEPAVSVADDASAQTDASSQLSDHLLELLEPAEDPCSVRARRSRSPPSEQLGHAGELNPVCQKELCDFRFPFALFDPVQPGAPAVARSAALSRLLDRQGWRGDLAIGGLLETVEEADECRALCESAMQGAYYTSGRCATSRVQCAQPLPEGELVCVERSVQPGECMVYLKQVELDDRMYVAGLWVRVPDHEEADKLVEQAAPMLAAEASFDQGPGPDLRLLLAFLCLSERMDALVQVLAALFWYSAPMRRQTACAEAAA